MSSFLQLSAMALGGFIEADRRLVAHEKMMRAHHRMQRDAAIWRSYEREFEQQGTPMPPGSRPQALNVAEEGKDSKNG
jgi:hypothetical protein